MEVNLSQALNKLKDMAKIRWRDGSSDFLDIASTFRYRLATDPRVKVFGLLGLQIIYLEKLLATNGVSRRYMQNPPSS